MDGDGTNPSDDSEEDDSDEDDSEEDDSEEDDERTLTSLSKTVCSLCRACST
jgi:hypothetical protein